MITYVYETIPKKAGEKVERFEWQQSILDDALKKHPETGVPVQRIMTDGIGFTSSREIIQVVIVPSHLANAQAVKIIFTIFSL